MKPRPETRAVLVHEIADARAALAAARVLGADVVLVSAASGAASLGPGWWQAMLRQMVAEYPEVQVTAILDCGARADLTQAALRQGLADICYRGPAGGARKLADIAAQRGARLHRCLPQALDLTGVADPEAACRAWLSKKRPDRPPG
jgi:hypothetical protein